MFSTFPDGLPAMGLLLLRITLAATCAWQALGMIPRLSSASPPTYILAMGIIGSGMLILLGLFTPVVGLLLIALEVVSIGFFGTSGALSLYALLLSAAIVLLGPGSVSIDSRLYGRREIVFRDS